MIDYPKNITPEEKMRLARALFHIGHLTETTPAVEWLGQELARLDRLNRTERDEVALRHRQGACHVIDGLLVMIAESRDKFDKFDEMRKP